MTDIFDFLIIMICIMILYLFAIIIALNKSNKKEYFFKNKEGIVIKADYCNGNSCRIDNKTYSVSEWWYEKK